MSIVKLSKRQVINVSYALLSSGLEYYNYMLLMYLIPLWGKVFFAPGQDVFLKGFGLIFFTALTRPISATLIGNIGDKIGRKQALLLCASIMSVSCLVIAFLPSYQDVEWVAKYGVLTAIIVLCRVLQIASASGKLNGSAIFLIEHFPSRAGLISSVIWFATIMGMCVASIVEGACAGRENMWRIAIGTGGILSFGSLIAARFLTDGSEYTKNKNTIISDEEQSPWPYIATFCIACGISGMFYYSTSYIPVLYQRIHGSLGNNRTIMLFVYAFSVLFSGLASDVKSRYPSRIGKVLHTSLIAILIGILIVFAKLPGHLIVPVLFIVSNIIYFSKNVSDRVMTHLIMLGGALICAGVSFFALRDIVHGSSLNFHFIALIALGFFVGPSHKVMTQLFPPNKRYKSVSLFYALGTSIVGGSSTFLSLKLEAINNMLPVAFITISALLAAFGVYASWKTGQSTNS